MIAAEIILAVRERRPAHVVDGRLIAPFPAENEAAVLRLRAKGVGAYPFVGPQQFVVRKDGAPTVSSGLFPLAGISRTTTELCNEAGRDVLYASDEHGFNNPFEVWNGRRFDLALIGDSFAHGVCVDSGNQLGTLIRNTIPATLNLGVLGAGPLAELAVLREYATPVRPRVVLWLFYEGNDIEDLVREEHSSLKMYLDPRLSQNLLTKQTTVDSLLRAYADSVLGGEVKMTPGVADIGEMLRLSRVRKAVGMVASNIPHRTAPSQFATLARILLLAKQEVEAWGGRIYFVFLPDYHRFDRRVLAYSGYVHNNAEIQEGAMRAARNAGIPVIDVAAAFAASPNPREYWPRSMSHYGPNGYALVARTILAALKKMPPG